jgi:4-amino-4-deoxy-L-arabinose transferase-like glycosyltransferase
MAEDHPVRPAELWIPAAISLAVGFRWLLGERHSIYGDEAFHLTNLFNGLASVSQGDLRDRLANLYLFNFAYPPVFHLLAVPFVFLSADPILGGRVYAQALTLLAALMLYTITREIGGRFAGAVAVATLLGTPSFVDVSRHYLLETLLILEILALLILISRYFRAREPKYVWLMAAVVSAGLLTKFNFFFYAAPLFVAPAAIEIVQSRRQGRRWAVVARAAAVIVGIPLIVAGPWYLARATGPMSATGMLSGLYEAGTLRAGLSLLDLLKLSSTPLLLNYSPLLAGLAVIAAIVYMADLMRIQVVRKHLMPLSPPQHVVVSSAMFGALCGPFLLALLGLAGTLRWHVEAVCLFIATFGVIGRVRPAAGRVLVAAAAAAAAVQLLTIYAAPIGAPGLLRIPDSGLTPRPSTVAIGSESLAHDLASHERRVGGFQPGDFAYFLYHEHAGPHFGSVEFYLRFFEGSPLAARIAGFNNRAIELDNIFGAKYLIDEVAGPGIQWQDAENVRYRRFMEHLPRAFRNLWIEVSDLQGRVGRFKAYYVPREQITSGMVMTAIDIGRKLETEEPFLMLWDAQRIIWRAKFEIVHGNTSLRDDIDALLPQMPIAEASLSALNRQLLRDYRVTIDRIRGNITAGEPRPSESN